MLFKDVVGHESLKKSFIQEINGDRVSHAQLFLGKTGFGSFSLAMAFVQYLLCENKGTNDSCGSCSTCKKVANMQHPDVHFSFPTVQANAKTSDEQFSMWRDMVMENPYASLNQWIGISDPKGRKPIISKHQSEQIVKKLSLKSFEGRHKVSIIWMGDEMNNVCANKLLKIIEEPPKDTVFILIAESQEKLLSTILSRTQLVKVKQLDDQAVTQAIKNRYQANDETVKSVVSRANGDLSSAFEMISTQGAESLNRERFIELMRVCYKKEVIPMMSWAEEMAKMGREDQKHFLRYALYMVRQSLMKNYTEEKLMRASPEEASFLSKFARFITGNNVLDFTNLFNESHYNVERNAHAKMLFTNITFEVMRYIHKA
jgi:DNA polymerase-3 subunit delta'